ncbi:MAG TPA: hypothetical protein VN397_00380, partial [Candidatus Methylomirabilis sp.]|nr:hypothetical protein [Candidatus Methylomirabilis sp.]
PDAGSDGSSGSGGAGGTGGSPADGGGAGGSAGSAGADGGGGTTQQPFSCPGWTRDTTFPPGMDLTGDIWASSASDVYVATGTYATGEIAHYDGSNWSLMTLPVVSGTWANMNAMWGSSANDVWAGGGYLPTMGSGRSRLLHRVNQGAWIIDPNFPWSSGEGTVRSIWGADSSDIFVMVDYYISSKRDVKIYRKSGSSWTSMTLPSHSPPAHMRQIWGKNASDVYAVGTQLDAGSNPVKGLLWHYDGNGSWKDVTTLPADVLTLGGVHGAGNVQVVGSYWDGSNYHGVRLASTDLTSWSRYNSAMTAYDSAVWSPGQGACLAGGAIPVPPINGAARLGTMSLGSWSPESQLDGTAAYVTGIAPVTASSQVWLATYGETGFAGAYKGSCQ